MANAAWQRGDIAEAARRLHISVTPHPILIARVGARIRKLDEVLAQAAQVSRGFDCGRRHHSAELHRGVRSVSPCPSSGRRSVRRRTSTMRSFGLPVDVKRLLAAIVKDGLIGALMDDREDGVSRS